jgi:glucose-6-phosphate dehydrogenase assembly protein OpcA
MPYAPIQSIVAGANSQLANAHSKMGDEVEDTIQRENESRVAQLREMRRMEHEREIERMRMEAEREKTAALIARLDAQSGKKVIRFPGGMVINGG